MACWRNHRCKQCGYEAEVSGGRDALMQGPTWTIACLDCKILTDVIVWGGDDLEHVKGGGRWSMAYPSPETQDLVQPECPYDKSHRVREWQTGGPCPKCDGEMEVDDDDFILAD